MLRTAFAAERSFGPRLRRYLAMQADGWLLAEEDGQVAGMVGAIDYGAFAYVGLMGVHPRQQGRGIGRGLLATLLGWLDGRGLPCVMLDATEVGARLYQQLGFVDTAPGCELLLGRRPAGAGEPGEAPSPDPS